MRQESSSPKQEKESNAKGDTIELTSIGVQFFVVEVYEKTTFDNTFAGED